MQEIFAWQFQKDTALKTETAKELAQNLDEIDLEITKAAPAWPIEQINKVDLAILRLAVFELIIVKDAPFKVIVDEAVELAKEFGTESSPTFINGALGNLINSKKIDQKEKNV